MGKLYRASIYAVVLSALFLFGVLAISTTSNAQRPRPEPRPRVETGAGIGIGTMCSGAIIGLARNPSEEDAINDNYEEALATLLSMPTRISAGEFSHAVGIIGGALVENIARNPSAEDELVALAERCIEDLMALL